MVQRLKEEGTVKEAKNDEMKRWRWIKDFVASCLKLLGCFGRNREHDNEDLLKASLDPIGHLGCISNM